MEIFVRVHSEKTNIAERFEENSCREEDCWVDVQSGSQNKRD